MHSRFLVQSQCESRVFRRLKGIAAWQWAHRPQKLRIKRSNLPYESNSFESFSCDVLLFLKSYSSHASASAIDCSLRSSSTTRHNPHSKRRWLVYALFHHVLMQIVSCAGLRYLSLSQDTDLLQWHISNC